MGDLQLYEPLDDATEAALRASIQRFGVIIPIVVDQRGRIIDGHHRSRIAKELGIRCDQLVRRVRSDDEALELARTLNEDRRQLPIEQRRTVVGDLRDQGHSLRAIAGAVGVSKDTVAKDLAQVSTGRHLSDQVAPDEIGSRDSVPDDDRTEAGGPGNDTRGIATPEPSPAPNPAPSRVVGRDGKSYPARRPDAADDLVAQRSEGERLMGTFTGLLAQLSAVSMKLLALSAEHVALGLSDEIGEDQWPDVLALQRRLLDLDEWFGLVISARPKPFTVVEGGRA